MSHRDRFARPLALGGGVAYLSGMHLLLLFLACGGAEPPAAPSAASSAAPSAASSAAPSAAEDPPALPSAAGPPRFQPQQEALPWPPDEGRSPDPAVAQAQALRTSDPAQARALVDTRLAAAPDDADALVLRSRLRPADEAEQAIADASRAVALEPEFAGARMALADRLVPLSRCAEALEPLSWLVDRYPQHAQAWTNRAHCRFATDDWDGGVADSTRACELGDLEACKRLPLLRARAARRPVTVDDLPVSPTDAAAPAASPATPE